VFVLEGQVAHRVCVEALPSGLASLARFAFQACSFNHSDISPFRIKHLRAVNARLSHTSALVPSAAAIMFALSELEPTVDGAQKKPCKTS